MNVPFVLYYLAFFQFYFQFSHTGAYLFKNLFVFYIPVMPPPHCLDCFTIASIFQIYLTSFFWLLFLRAKYSHLDEHKAPKKH